MKSAARSAAAGLMLLLWLATVVVSLAPDLHESLHQDSHSGKHECVITLLGKSQILTGLVPILVPAPNVAYVMLPPVPVARPLAALDFFLAPSRGPPALLPLHRG